MFSKMTLILEKNSIIACFGLVLAVCGLVMLTKTFMAEKVSKKHGFIVLTGTFMMVIGLMVVLNSEKVTSLLLHCSEYLLGFLS